MLGAVGWCEYCMERATELISTCNDFHQSFQSLVIFICDKTLAATRLCLLVQVLHLSIDLLIYFCLTTHQQRWRTHLFLHLTNQLAWFQMKREESGVSLCNNFCSFSLLQLYRSPNRCADTSWGGSITIPMMTRPDFLHVEYIKLNIRQKGAKELVLLIFLLLETSLISSAHRHFGILNHHVLDFR